MRKVVLPRRSRKIRVAIYLRVSTVKQLKGYGLEVQLDECLAWLDYKIGKGSYVYEVYTDGGVSGKLAHRPDLDALNADLEALRYDLVIFGKLDRIGRTMRDIHRWVYDITDIEVFGGVKVRVATADGRIDSEDDMFGIQLSLLAYMAELEHAMILDRTMGGREKKLAQGGWPGGVAPFWLELPKKGVSGPPTLREKGVRFLEVSARLLADELLPAEEAATALNALGYETARGLPWTGANLIRTWMQTALDGYIVYRNVESGRGSVRLGPDGKPLYGETVRIPVPVPLPTSRVREVRRALARRSFTKENHKDYLLSRRVTALCGAHYVGAHREARGRTSYRCSGRRSDPPCDCQEILARPLEDVVWREVVRTLGDPEKLRTLAEEWLGDVPGEAQVYEERLAALDEELERSQRLRKKKLVALAEVLAADESDDAETELEIKASIAEVKDELQSKERRLRDLRADAAERLLEVQQREERVHEVVEQALDVAPRLGALEFAERLDLLDLVDIEVRVTSHVPGMLRNAGCPFEGWFEERGLLVPPELTDDDWQRVEACFPVPKKKTRIVPPRVAFEASLYKVRHGLQWKNLPEEVLQGHRPNSVYQRVLGYLKDGSWGAAVRALGDYEGTPMPPLYVLPDLDITGTFDPALATLPESPMTCDDDDTTCEGAAERKSSSSWPTRASSTATTGRSCAPCSAPPTTAA
ncbi:recombinase family protein [Streptomyces sp. NPDC056956]|uniref:recombinase family protein n=1 Tax=Streptomyces sp. NPDC056956 TaxID=3345980 RepID=UPI00362D7053